MIVTSKHNVRIIKVSSRRMNSLNGFINSLIRNSYSTDQDNNSIYRRRNWVQLNAVNDENKTFTISSYNILSRHYIWKQVYEYLPKHLTNWDNRFKMITKNMEDFETDIMCFQEMENLVYQEYWSKHFADTYDSRFMIKPKPQYWTKEVNMMDGVGIFVKKDKFKILASNHINFADIAADDSYFDQTDDLKSRVLGRNTVALLVVLEHLPTKKRLFVTNTHLYWNPKHSDVSLLHTYMLTKIIKHNLQDYLGCSDDELEDQLKNEKFHVIMCGDFNSTPDSMTYQFLSNGSIDIQNNEWFKKYHYGRPLSPTLISDFKLSSAYKYLFENKLMSKTTYSNHFREIIDYIWYTNSNIKLIKSLGDIENDYLDKYEGFPNEEYPSDHIPIVSKFEFRDSLSGEQ